MKKHKTPPQGTQSIEGEGRERRAQYYGEQSVTAVLAYRQIKDDPLWELIARRIPDPAAWNNLCERVGKDTVALGYKFWRFTSLGKEVIDE